VFSFTKRDFIDDDWGVVGDLDVRQAGDSDYLVEVAPRTFATSSLEFFPGAFSSSKPGKAGMADLGAIRLADLRKIPVDDLRTMIDRDGLPVVEGHVYVLRTFDGKRCVAFVVEKIEDQPPM
jgi:hypothetical protein